MQLDRASLPAWMCDAVTFEEQGFVEDLSRDALRRSHGRGAEWRACSPNIVATITTQDPAAFCALIWTSKPTVSLLAWCRGALGQPFEDTPVTPAATEPARKLRALTLF